MKLGIQNYCIIKHLLGTKKGLTAAEWARLTGCTKLTSRISELRDIGYKFTEVWQDSEIRKRHYKRYFLKSIKKA